MIIFSFTIKNHILGLGDIIVRVANYHDSDSAIYYCDSSIWMISRWYIIQKVRLALLTIQTSTAMEA